MGCLAVLGEMEMPPQDTLLNEKQAAELCTSCVPRALLYTYLRPPVSRWGGAWGIVQVLPGGLEEAAEGREPAEVTLCFSL